MLSTPLFLISLLITIPIAGLSALYFVSLLYSSLSGSPYVPISRSKIHVILNEADLKKGSVFLELGSGDGRVVRTAVKRYGMRGVGIEINPVLVVLSRALSKLQNVQTVIFKREDLFTTSLTDAHVIFLFLMPHAIRKLESRLASEPKKQALIISHGFPIHALEDRLIRKLTADPYPTFFYRT